ncbi:MAG TPA: hypothetical protein VFH83_01750 [Spirochaetia bacterium]|nr:hypothetical protein [Spirochaetia bacterium]
MSDIVPRNTVSKQGVHGVVGVAGGIGTIILAGLNPVLGIVVGGVMGVIGLAFARGTKSERVGGIITAALGAGTVLSGLGHLLRHGGSGLFSGLMYGAGILLVGYGGVSLYRFFRNLRKRM